MSCSPTKFPWCSHRTECTRSPRSSRTATTTSATAPTPPTCPLTSARNKVMAAWDLCAGVAQSWRPLAPSWCQVNEKNQDLWSAGTLLSRRRLFGLLAMLCDLAVSSLIPKVPALLVECAQFSAQAVLHLETTPKPAR